MCSNLNTHIEKWIIQTFGRLKSMEEVKHCYFVVIFSCLTIFDIFETSCDFIISFAAVVSRCSDQCPSWWSKHVFLCFYFERFRKFHHSCICLHVHVHVLYGISNNIGRPLLASVIVRTFPINNRVHVIFDMGIHWKLILFFPCLFMKY